MRNRQRTQQQCIYHAEHQCICTNADGQQQGDSGRKDGTLGQQPRAESDIAKNCLVPLLFIHDVDQRTAVAEARDVVFNGAEHAAAVAIGPAGDVRRDNRIRKLP